MTGRKRMPPTLARRLLWLGAAPSVVMFLALLVFFTTARLEDARNELIQSGQSLADNLAPAVEYGVVTGNGQILQQILSQSLPRSNASWIRVTDILGTEMAYVAREGWPLEGDNLKVFEAEILQEPLDLSRDSETQWFQPDYAFGAGSLRIGSVQVGVSMTHLEEERKDILWTSTGVGVALLLFTLIFVNRILHGIVAPVQSLSERVRRLKAGHYQPVPASELHSTEEVRELEENLNELAQHLEQLKSSRDQTLTMSETSRERAEAANLAKSEFLAVMSHELRTPLNGVLGMIELISEDPLTERQRDYIRTARQSTEDLLTVISDILDFSRLDRGKLELDSQNFDVRQLIENCVATFRHLAEKQGLALNLEWTGEWPEGPWVQGDGPRLRQILASLVDNAIKFTDHGSVSIAANWSRLEDDVMLLNCTVTDSGAGIPSDRMREIFDTFEQLDHSHARRHGGTGIGLAMVQRLVELMGGHIQVETDLGRGSSFCFELPIELASEQIREPVNPPEKPLPTTFPTSRALVVEDNLVNQRVATALLNRLGFETDAVSNGKEAVDRVRASHSGYTVILMDCQMPEMDGYEATREIRDWERSHGQGQTPIIALTADALPGTRGTCQEAGMNDYLTKPVRKENLREVLSRWVAI